MKVTITYFKTTGKYYTEDEDVEWPADPTHYSKWKPFEAVVRIKDMFAVCMETPLGYPQFCYPQKLDELNDVAERARTAADRNRLTGLDTPRQTCPTCGGTCAVSTGAGASLHLTACPECRGRGTIPETTA